MDHCDELTFILQPKKQCAAMKIESWMDVLILEMMATGTFPDFIIFFSDSKNIDLESGCNVFP